jgi:solute carrier family 13 (sodium-dependent dicarboxylate transporter), member 2/3/5
VGALPVAWWLVSVAMVPAAGQTPEVPAVDAWRPGQRGALAVVAVTMVAWLTRKPIALGFVTLPGWGDGLPMDDAWVAVAGALCLFLLRGEGGTAFLDLKAMELRIPWPVLFLLGGGFALAEGIKSSGLTDWLALGTSGLAALPGPVAALGICVAVTFLTELTSNTATTQVLLPVLAAGAVANGIDPVTWMVPATISASCAFMLPVATPPNAVAAELGHVAPGDMARVGLGLNLALAGWATVVGAFWAPFVWSIGPR